MAESNAFSKEAILKYITDKGGRVSNQALVKHFKQYLSDSANSGNTRAVFKEWVNAVASIKQEDGVKYIILKKRSHEEKKKSNCDIPSSLEQNGESKKFRISQESISEKSSGDYRHQIIHSHSSPSIMGSESISPGKESSPESLGSQPTSPTVLWSSDLPPGHIPQPPPRRKHSVKGKENRGTKYEQSVQQRSDPSLFSTSPQKNEIKEIVSPGTVKEKAKLLNRMASELDLSQKTNGFAPVPMRRREHRGDKCIEDDDTCSVSTMDPRRKEWLIKSAKSDYHELVRLLREEPRLANVKDFNSTALHWAAKHGNLDVIKLIAGTHKVNSNARTGYTPLHLAAIFGNEEIMEVLINTYGADPSVRDYSGKRALQYLQKKQAERFVTLFPSMVPLNRINSGRSEKDLNFMRMGSLNSKVKKPSMLSAGGKALTRMKSWGSADNIQGKASILMPPPKTIPKKKKSRKQSELGGLYSNSRNKFCDSDSDSASGGLS